jgi:hypothetical protein
MLDDTTTDAAPTPPHRIDKKRLQPAGFLRETSTARATSCARRRKVMRELAKLGAQAESALDLDRPVQS